MVVVLRTLVGSLGLAMKVIRILCDFGDSRYVKIREESCTYMDFRMFVI